MNDGMKIGIGVTGSFCSLRTFMIFLKEISQYAIDIYVFVTPNVYAFDTRFYKCKDLIHDIELTIRKKVIVDIVEAEKFGPKIPLDLMLVYPCSSNTLAKLCYGINDNAVTMAVKSTLRNDRNIVLGICSNDVLGNSGRNMMDLLNRKHYYLVPMYMDNIDKKPNSMLTARKMIIPTMKLAYNNQQMKPLFLSNNV